VGLELENLQAVIMKEVQGMSEL